MSICNTSKLINNKLRAHILHISIIGVGKMFLINACTIISTHAIALSSKKRQSLHQHQRRRAKKKTHRIANIKRSRHKASGDAVGTIVLFNTIHVSRGSATIAVYIACQTCFMQRVTDKKHALDSSVFRTGQLYQSIHRGGSTLRVSLEDKAFIGIALQSGFDLVDDILRSRSRVLGVVGWVNGVVDDAAGDLGEDVAVHG